MEQSDDDEDEWETLSGLPTRHNEPSDSTPSPHQTDHAADEADASNQQQAEGSTVLALSSSARLRESDQRASSNNNQSRILAVSERLESKKRVRDKLVHHPLNILWTRFFRHLLSEIWNLDSRVQLSLLLILLGLITKCILLSTAMLWYPRLFLVPALVLVPFFYLNPSYIPVKLERAVRLLQDPSRIVDSLGEFDPSALRRIVCASLFIPTILEVRTIQFLSQIQVEAAWGFLYHLVTAALIAAAMFTSYVKYDKSPRECSHIGLVGLYGSALLIVTWIQFDVWKIPLLVAPFCVASGILLLHSVDDNYEWCTRAIRHSLRLSMRDALASVSESVSQDEMLQLAMLRWLVDYWGSTQPTAATAAADRQTTAPGSQENRQSSSSSGVTLPNRSVAVVNVPPERELSWSELLPMLTLTSEQMRSEVDVLQRGNGDSLLTGAQARRNQPTSSIPSPPPSSPSNASASVIDFQTMLASMDLDTHAKPAVMNYKMAVQSFPPSREIAILLSVARRCPALLALLWELLVAQSGGFSSTITLLPFIAFELFRCKSWGESCKRAATQSTSASDFAEPEALFLENVDPMIILLSGDKLSLHRPPTLLGVWMNVVSSVSALEMGLTAARAAQTTSAAIDFAQNIMSLAEFGYEVASQGWMHGAALLAKELIIHHTSSASQGASSNQTKYTNAALKAVKNSRTVSRNIQVLIKDENTSHVLPPVVGFLSMGLGRGWLWGRDDVVPPRAQQSTVVIEELDQDNAEIVDVSDETVRNITGGNMEEEEPLSHTDFSEVMDLIAAAATRQLIDRAEKDDLCERLLRLKSGETVDKRWLQATKRTMEGLILIDDRVEDATVSCSSHDEAPCQGQTGDSVGVDRQTLPAALSCASEEIKAVEYSLSILRQSSITSPPGDAVSGIDVVGQETTVTTEVLSETDEPSGDNVWMQLGGGLAVVGAVVGMAAIALQSNSARDNHRRREGQRPSDELHPSQ